MFVLSSFHFCFCRLSSLIVNFYHKKTGELIATRQQVLPKNQYSTHLLFKTNLYILNERMILILVDWLIDIHGQHAHCTNSQSVLIACTRRKHAIYAPEQSIIFTFYCQYLHFCKKTRKTLTSLSCFFEKLRVVLSYSHVALLKI